MKTFKTKSGPFLERPFYSDSDIEKMCVAELSAVGLLPQTPGPVRIDRFIEKRFVVPTYQDLGEGILGLTRFTSRGVAEIVVSKELDDEGSEIAERRIRTTLAHEGGHGLLHTHLFVLAMDEQPLFGDFSDPKKPKILCRDEKSGGSAYKGQWWEYQANKAMGSLLMPAELVIEAAMPFLQTRGTLGVQVLDASKRQIAVRELAAIFDVNPAVARIRLEQIYPKEGLQLALYRSAEFEAYMGNFPIAVQQLIRANPKAAKLNFGTGEKAFWRAFLRLGEEHIGDSGLAHAMLGEKDEAFREFERALEDDPTAVVVSIRRPGFDSLHSDPRYAALLRRVNLSH